MASPEDPRAGVEAYFVLKQGGMHGPFTRAELEARLENGIVSMDDFVQVEGVPIWRPLARVLGGPVEDTRGAIAPDWRSIVTWAWLRLRYDLDQESVISGWVCLAIGLIALSLANWTVIFWLPWVIASLIAALALWQHRRFVHGALLLAAAILLPLGIFALQGPKRLPSASTPTEPIAQPASEPAAVPPPRPPVANPPAPTAPASPAANLEATAPPLAESAPTVDPLLDPKMAAPPIRQLPAAAPAPSLGETPAVTPMTPAQSDLPPSSRPTLDGRALTGGELVQRHQNSLVLVSERNSAGSGFLATSGGRTWLFTNTHVAAGMQKPSFMRVDGKALKISQGEVAVGYDATRFSPTEGMTASLEIISDFDSAVKIGDAVFVLGNSGGGGVVTSLQGTIVGIGPDRIEVSAEFIPGNSGSPIIHGATGKVIGIATYLTRRYDDFSKGSAGPTDSAKANPANVVVRRFGFRLDTGIQWQQLNWAVFQNEARSIEAISAFTGDIFDFLGALRKREEPVFSTTTLSRPAEAWLAAIRRPRMSEVDREQATRSFLTTLRTLVQADVVAAQSRLRYSYFQNELSKEREVRDQLFKAFDEQARKPSAPSVGRTR